MNRAALDELQMHGQDIPWLLQHWATHKPDHPALAWDPPEGNGRQWTYAELLDATHGLAVGLRDRGLRVGDKVLIHAENSPEMLVAWLACATLGAVAVTTNTRSVVAEIAYFAAHAGCVAAVADASYADAVAQAAPTLEWIAVTPGSVEGSRAAMRCSCPGVNGASGSVARKLSLDIYGSFEWLTCCSSCPTETCIASVSGRG